MSDFSFRNFSRTTNINLLDGTYWQLRNNWQVGVPAITGDMLNLKHGAQYMFRHKNPVNETFDLVSTDIGGGRQTFIAIERFLEDARDFHGDPHNLDSRWLEWRSGGVRVGFNTEEIAAKRSLIYYGTVTPMNVGLGVDQFMYSTGNTPYAPPHQDEARTVARVALVRHPYWEAISASSMTASNLTSLGDMVNISINGTAPGRIWRARFRGESGNTYKLGKIWAGLRPAYQGVGAFVPTFECESTAVGGHAWHYDNDITAYDTVDAACSGGYKASIGFDGTDHGEDMCRRIVIVLGNVVDTLYYNHFVGSYLVLLRARVAAGTTALVRLHSGMYNTTTYPDLFYGGEYVYIDDTNWRLYPMGEIHIPPGRWFSDYVGSLEYFAVELQAQRLSGTGNLALDCVTLIPSRHFVHTENTYATDVNYYEVYTAEDDYQFGQTVFESGVTPSIDDSVNIRDWYIPTGNSMMVVAHEGITDYPGLAPVSDLDDEMTYEFDYYSRWNTYYETTETT